MGLKNQSKKSMQNSPSVSQISSLMLLKLQITMKNAKMNQCLKNQLVLPQPPKKPNAKKRSPPKKFSPLPQLRPLKRNAKTQSQPKKPQLWLQPLKLSAKTQSPPKKPQLWPQPLNPMNAKTKETKPVQKSIFESNQLNKSKNSWFTPQVKNKPLMMLKSAKNKSFIKLNRKNYMFVLF